MPSSLAVRGTAAEERLLEGAARDFHRPAGEIDGDRLKQRQASAGRPDHVLERVVAVDLPEHRHVGRGADAEMAEPGTVGS